jgi:aspartate aminotransferase
MMLSQRAMQINPSPTLAITAKAKEMKKQGIDVISFGAGEPDFDTPDHIKQAAIKAIHEGFTKYTETSGIPELKQAICGKLKKDNNLSYTSEQILVSTGAKQCLYNIIQVLVDPGDEVIIPAPFWVSYEEMVKLAGGVCKIVKTNNFKINKKLLEQNITKKTKVLILGSPSNPTGVVYDSKELQEIADLCVINGVYVISDEIYEPLIYEKKHVSIASLNDEIKKLTIVVNGVSKTYSMTGWRIGYCAGEKEIIKAASSLQDHSTSNPNSIAQKAAVAALLGSQEIVAIMKDAYKKRRDYMVKRIQSIKGLNVQKPDGAFYVFVDVSSLFRKKVSNSVEFCSQLLEKAHVAAVPGKAFGDDRYIRLSYATNEENIKKGLDRLESFANNLLQ